MLIGLTLLSASCANSPAATPKFEPDWPQVPDPSGKVCLLEEDTVIPAGTVVMTLEFWIEISRYVVAVERVRESIEGEAQ